MLSYLVGLLILALFSYNPLVRLLGLAPLGTGPIHRSPRPQINEELLALESANQTNRCIEDAYSVHVFSREPLILYIENFLSLPERKHLLQIRWVPRCRPRHASWGAPRRRRTSNQLTSSSTPLFQPSTITDDGGASTHRDSTVRDSDVALIPRSDVVRCIEDRARALQGWREEVWVERLRVQRYGQNGHYSHHFDWSPSRGGWGRVSSFMVWVDDGDGELRGGGTEFPSLRPKADMRWCQFVECRQQRSTPEGGEETQDDQQGVGVVFKPLPGNAVYWENFRSHGSGRGYDETWHAGLPVEKGVKVGLNIWSWGRIG